MVYGECRLKVSGSLRFSKQRARSRERSSRPKAAFRDAEARERQAEAEAQATSLVSDAIVKGDVRAINYFIAQRYVDALAQFANSPNQKVMFMPMESAGVIGAIGGIAEIAKQAFGNDAE